MIQHRVVIPFRIIALGDNFWRVYAHCLSRPPHLLISLPTDQHIISPAHARIYSLGLATLRNHCSNLDLSSFIHIPVPVAIASTSIAHIPIPSPLHVHNYSHPYCPITVYRFSLAHDHRPSFFFSQCSVCSTPNSFFPALSCVVFRFLRHADVREVRFVNALVFGT